MLHDKFPTPPGLPKAHGRPKNPKRISVSLTGGNPLFNCTLPLTVHGYLAADPTGVQCFLQCCNPRFGIFRLRQQDDGGGWVFGKSERKAVRTDEAPSLRMPKRLNSSHWPTKENRQNLVETNSRFFVFFRSMEKLV